MGAATAAPPLEAAGDIEDDEKEGGATTQLFELAAVTIDEAQPNIVKLSFSGEIQLTRDEAEWIGFYNRLAAGKVSTLKLGVFVAGAKKTHRRDGDGNVDAVVETKSVKITDIHLDNA